MQAGSKPLRSDVFFKREKSSAMPAKLSCTILLPDAYRREEILAFHRRDPEAGAERVTECALQKGLVWAGRPACLEVRFGEGQVEAELAMDGSVAGNARQLEALVRRMLGLTQPVEEFEARYREHPHLGGLINRHAGLRVAVAATPFEALSWAIIGQQISVSAAVSMRRKLIRAVGLRHKDLFCYPGAAEVAELSSAALRKAGLSTAKAETLLRVAEQTAAGAMPLEDWAGACPVDEIRQRLLAVRGIGPWTVNYTLLRGYAWLDGSLHGDVAVRRGLQRLLGRTEKVGAEEAEAWLAQFSPWRALVAAHLWALKSRMAY